MSPREILKLLEETFIGPSSQTLKRSLKTDRPQIAPLEASSRNGWDRYQQKMRSIKNNVDKHHEKYQ